MLQNPFELAARRQRLLEVSLALGLCFALVLGTAANTQTALAEKLVRLHILANSDSDHDQQVKLRVRDDLLRRMEGQSELPDLDALQSWAEQSLAEQNESMEVRVEKTRMYFDTREYETFALPAGYYDAVRVILGEGKGQNWWCVLFPPLCTGACERQFSELAQDHGMSPGEIAFVTRDGTKYRLRFKAVEFLWEFTHGVFGI